MALALAALVGGCGASPAESAAPHAVSSTAPANSGPAGTRSGPAGTGSGPAGTGSGPAGTGSGPAGTGSGPAGTGSPEYYLALGDSLAAGVQPNARGISLPTRHGYPNQLQALLRDHGRVLSLVALGCPGETTGTLIHGGICGYAGRQRRSLSGGGGSQFATALGFLRAHRGHVPLITIDIGANDLAPCLKRRSAVAAAACAESAIVMVKRNTARILGSLRAAARPTTIVGMTYYAPQLAEWLTGAAGHAYTVGALSLVEAGNAALASDFAASQARVADVFTAFQGSDWSGRSALAGFGLAPTAVARICEWTWACAPPPVGPNVHANTTGYGIIAATFYRVLHDLGLANGRPGRVGE